MTSNGHLGYFGRLYEEFCMLLKLVYRSPNYTNLLYDFGDNLVIEVLFSLVLLKSKLV